MIHWLTFIYLNKCETCSFHGCNECKHFVIIYNVFDMRISLFCRCLTCKHNNMRWNLIFHAVVELEKNLGYILLHVQYSCHNYTVTSSDEIIYRGWQGLSQSHVICIHVLIKCHNIQRYIGKIVNTLCFIIGRKCKFMV